MQREEHTYFGLRDENIIQPRPISGEVACERVAGSNKNPFKTLHTTKSLKPTCLGSPGGSVSALLWGSPAVTTHKCLQRTPLLKGGTTHPPVWLSHWERMKRFWRRPSLIVGHNEIFSLCHT